METPQKLATAADFQKLQQVGYYELAEDVIVSYQALGPGDIMLIYSAPLSWRMTRDGLKDKTVEKMVAYSKTLTPQEETEVNIEYARRGVIRAVTSTEFVLKHPSKCNADEISIYIIPDDIVINLWQEIRKFSGVNEDEDTFQGDNPETGQPEDVESSERADAQ